jgi:hypothetical protein
LDLEIAWFGSAQLGGIRARIEAPEAVCFRSVNSGSVRARLSNSKRKLAQGNQFFGNTAVFST